MAPGQSWESGLHATERLAARALITDIKIKQDAPKTCNKPETTVPQSDTLADWALSSEDTLHRPPRGMSEHRDETVHV